MRTVVLADDIDGSTPAETIPFSVNGKHYEMELGKRHLDAMLEVLAPFIEKARPAGRDTASGKPPRGTARHATLRRREYLNKVREWARQNGHPNLSNYGQVPASIHEAYEKAHS